MDTEKGTRNMKRELASGTLLIAGPAVGVTVMLLHPTAHGLMDPEAGPRLSFVNAFVHGLALVAAPMTFLGLAGLWRRLKPSDLATAALVAYGWGAVAVMSAAVASGFVAPGAIALKDAADGSNVSATLLMYTHLWNQGFAKVNVVATSIGIVLFSIAILRGGRESRLAGMFGAIVGVAILLFFFAGHLTLDIHGFGAVTFAQSAWFIWIGVLLWGEPK